MALPALKLVDDLDVSPDNRLETLQRDYAELNSAIFEAAQVHRRLCAPSLVRHGAFEVASEIFAVRHLPGDFFSVEETADGLVLARMACVGRRRFDSDDIRGSSMPGAPTLIRGQHGSSLHWDLR